MFVRSSRFFSIVSLVSMFLCANVVNELSRELDIKYWTVKWFQLQKKVCLPFSNKSCSTSV